MGRLGHTLSTLRPAGHPTGRKTRFRLLARLYRVGSMTHWVPPKGFELFPTSLPLSQAYPGASALRSDTQAHLAIGLLATRDGTDADSGSRPLILRLFRDASVPNSQVITMIRTEE